MLFRIELGSFTLQLGSRASKARAAAYEAFDPLWRSWT